MPRTYGAILKGNRLEWVRKALDYEGNCSIPVKVTILEEGALPKNIPRGQEMAAILEKLAESGAFSEIEDPVSWQREIRKDRALPGS